MALELESLEKAVTALDLVWQKSNDSEFMSGLDAIAGNAIKSGVIQHFEFTLSAGNRRKRLRDGRRLRQGRQEVTRSAGSPE